MIGGLLLLTLSWAAEAVTKEQIKEWLSNHPDEKAAIWKETKEPGAYQARVRERVRESLIAEADTLPPSVPSDSFCAAGADSPATQETTQCDESMEDAQPVYPILHAFERAQARATQVPTSLASQLLSPSASLASLLQNPDDAVEGTLPAQEPRTERSGQETGEPEASAMLPPWRSQPLPAPPTQQWEPPRPIAQASVALPSLSSSSTIQVFNLQVQTLPNGMLPDANTILQWMAQYPPGAPLWNREGQADLLYDSTGSKVIGVYCKGPNGGSVNVYLSGKVVIQGNPTMRQHLASMVRDWTQQRVGTSSQAAQRVKPSLAAFRGQPY